MTTRPIYTDITQANAEIRDMESHMHIMKRMIAVQSKRIDNFKELVKVLQENINSRIEQKNSFITLMEAWLKMLEKDQEGLVMESMDRIIATSIKETI